MSPNVEKLLSEVPRKEVLHSVSPPAAIEFGVLPVDVRKPEGSGEAILDVVGLEGAKRVDRALGLEMFGKRVNYRGKVDEGTWERAYDRFYAEFL